MSPKRLGINYINLSLRKLKLIKEIFLILRVWILNGKFSSCFTLTKQKRILEIPLCYEFVCERLLVADFQADGKEWRRKPSPNASPFFPVHIPLRTYVEVRTYFLFLSFRNHSEWRRKSGQKF